MRALPRVSRRRRLPSGLEARKIGRSVERPDPDEDDHQYSDDGLSSLSSLSCPDDGLPVFDSHGSPSQNPPSEADQDEKRTEPYPTQSDCAMRMQNHQESPGDEADDPEH